jgi:hypothetical protein
MSVNFLTNRIWSSECEIAIMLFLQSHNFKEFVVFEDSISDPYKSRVAFSVSNKDWMLLKLKYHNLHESIDQFISANRRQAYQMRLNQLYEQVVSADA